MNEDRELAFKKEARQKLVQGVKILSDAVTTTLGPKGRNVAIQRPWGAPIVVHDGVTVAREVGDDNPLVLMGINLVRIAAQKTNEIAGDGTTTATLLAHELVMGGMDLLDKGNNPMVLRSEIYDVLPKVLKKLDDISEKVKSKEQIANVAFISSADKHIGELVAEALYKVGKDGLVTVDEGKGIDTDVEYTRGLEFDRGYWSPYFITNDQRMEATINEPAILITNEKLSLIKEIVPVLEKMAEITKDIVIIGEVSGDALTTMVTNKMKGNINAAAVRPPSTGDRRTALLEDIAVSVGGKLIDKSTPLDLNNMEDFVGRAKKMVVGRDNSVIIESGGDKEIIKERISSIRSLIKTEKSQFQKEILEERLAKLTTGVAVVKVGSKTELDMREKVERVKDAVGAATAARDEGVVAGGGTAFLLLKQVLDSSTDGQKLLSKVLESPIRKLMSNSGETTERADEVIKKVEERNSNFGYDVNSGEIVDLNKSGIIDPKKVVRLALENAISVATSILTTNALISIRRKDDKRKQG